jgi:hypothetical protein
VSSVTLQGVADLLSDAVICADEPAHFADSVVSLLNDDAARAAIAGRARKAAEAYFGKDVAFADFREWLLGRGNQGVDFGATDHARM